MTGLVPAYLVCQILVHEPLHVLRLETVHALSLRRGEHLGCFALRLRYRHSRVELFQQSLRKVLSGTYKGSKIN